MRCPDNCGYYYRAEGEDFERCHFEGPDGWAPCEQEEYYDDEAENDMVYYEVEVEYE